MRAGAVQGPKSGSGGCHASCRKQCEICGWVGGMGVYGWVGEWRVGAGSGDSPTPPHPLRARVGAPRGGGGMQVTTTPALASPTSRGRGRVVCIANEWCSRSSPSLQSVADQAGLMARACAVHRQLTASQDHKEELGVPHH